MTHQAKARDAGDASSRAQERARILARDRALWHAAQQGDTERLLELLGLYESYFFHLCVRFGARCEEEQIDMYQDVVLTLLESLQKYEIRHSFGGLLGAIMRTLGRKRPQAPPPLPEDIPGSSAGPPREAERREFAEKLVECTERLKERERRVFEARQFEHVSFADLAAELDVTLNHIRVIGHRALVSMRACLEKKGVRIAV
jgi:RNA polymerase sigma factor (sigma-70 family)